MSGMKGPESAMIEVHEVPAPVRGLAVASFGMSFFALLVFWWIPFGFLLSFAASSLGILSIILGVRTKARGIYYPLAGILISGFAATNALLTTKLSELIFIRFI
jgi:hypothetical protein